jgi:ACS family hexuronate transporter-like MFS transporter
MVPRRANRWIPTAAMMLLSLLSYVDRNVLAILSPTILRETRISAEDYGWIISAFSFAYLVGNPVWGRLLDRFGVRVGVAAAAALWTCASAGHAFATGVATFAIGRAVLGFGEGATFPGGMRTATHTLAPESRARGVALAYSGGSLGAIVTPLLVTPVALRWGWRGAFGCTGALGVAWLLLWAIVSRQNELRAPADDRRTPHPSLGDRSLWGFMAADARGGLPIGFVIYGAPIHLSAGLGCDQRTLGHVLWLPPLGWEVGYFFWGWMVDRSRSPGRFARLFALLALLALPLALTPLSHSLAVVLVLLFLGMFVAAGFVVAALSEVTHRHSIEHGAYLAGLGAGSWSGVVALVMPLFGWLFGRGAFGAAYAIATACPVAGWLLWRALDSDRRNHRFG